MASRIARPTSGIVRSSSRWFANGSRRSSSEKGNFASPNPSAGLWLTRKTHQVNSITLKLHAPELGRAECASRNDGWVGVGAAAPRGVACPRFSEVRASVSDFRERIVGRAWELLEPIDAAFEQGEIDQAEVRYYTGRVARTSRNIGRRRSSRSYGRRSSRSGLGAGSVTS